MIDFPEVSLADWRRRVTEELGGEPLDSLRRRGPDGIELEPLYAAQPATSSGPLWGETRASVCPIVEVSDPVDVAAGIAEDLAGGANGIWLRVEAAARLGLSVEAADDDAVPADGAGFHHGASLHHGTDVAEAFRELDLEGADVWLDAGANALPLAALWLAECERSGRDASGVRVHFGSDPLGALARDGALPRDLMRLSSEMASLARFAARHLPLSSAIDVSTAVYQEAGADPVEELAFMVATLVEYLRWAEDSGLGPAEVAPMTSLRFAVGTRVFPEIAKLRAARLLWVATLGALGVEAPPEPRLHVVGSRRVLTMRQPELNLLRGTEQAFIALAGGADAVSLWGFDRCCGASTGMARRLARDTTLILGHEAGLARVADPAAGSYLVESLSDSLARLGWALAQEIERRGGMRRMLVSGAAADRVERSARRRRTAFESGSAAITGVTDYTIEEEPREEDATTAALERRQRLERHRDTWRAMETEMGYSRDFVVEDLVGAARRGATLHELGIRLGGAEGAERAPALVPRRDAEPFEAPLEVAGEEE